ncbi:hypothetical protein ACU8OS_35355 (plasmid) [Rhizobium leguminosarum]
MDSPDTRSSLVKVLPINVDLTTDVENAARDGLGSGLLSTLAVPQGLLVDPGKFESQPDSLITFTLKLVDSRSTYASELALSANAKFGFASGSASLRIEMSQSFRSNSRSLFVILTKDVHTELQFIRKPLWTKSARDHFARSKGEYKKNFLLRYGDRFAQRLMIGGTFRLIYRLGFDSFEDASDFSARFEARYGNSSGAVDFHRRIVRAGVTSSISVQGLCSGVKKSPNLFYQDRGEEQKSRDLSVSDKLVDELLKYHNEFEGHVRDDKVESTIFFEMNDAYIADNAPDYRIDLVDYNFALRDAAEMDDVIDTRLAQLEYIRDVAYVWNRSATKDEIDKRITALSTLARKLEREVYDIAHITDKRPLLSFGLGDIPELPRSWVARRLRPARGYYTDIPYALNQLGPSTFTHTSNVPELEPEMPMGFSFNMHKETADRSDGVDVRLSVKVVLTS